MAKALTRALEAQRAVSVGAAAVPLTSDPAARDDAVPWLAAEPSAAPTVPDQNVKLPDYTAIKISYVGGLAFPMREQFRECFHKLRDSLQAPYYDAIKAACAEFSIDTPLRVAAALSQWGHETMGLQFLEELGGKSYWLRYEGRRDLGNTTQGDGIKYHGRGLTMLTGKANYAEFGGALGLPLVEHPELAGVMPGAARVAGLFWQRRGLNALADLDTPEGFQRLTIVLNGGLNGYDDRFRRWIQCRKIMGIDPQEA